MKDIQPSTQRPTLVLVDGTCIACNGIVRFIVRHDRCRRFRYAHLQGELAREVLQRHGLQPDIDTIYAITDYGGPEERVHVDGEAGRQIWPRLFRVASLLRFVPLPLLNLQYRFFAKIRYRLFGQASTCILPSPEERTLFLEADAGNSTNAGEGA